MYTWLSLSMGAKDVDSMKPSWEWTEDDLLMMKTAQTQESLNLEFKGSLSLAKDQSKKDEISKDVSALANSDGGVILYGVWETKTRPSSFEDLDSGIDPSDITPEWLEQIINSNIQRRVDGIRINPIKLTKTHPGKCAYAIFVPQSSNAPHQASDKKYYKRFNFHSVPMEDYEIRDIRNRTQKTATSH
jgi:predicted HTH transcriptional regulator